jgi:AraC-type DNA-binding domain-containing proteins
MNARLHAMFRPIQANGRVAAYRYVEMMPSPCLKPFVSCYWASEPMNPAECSPAASCEAAVDRVLPDACTDILFEHDLNENRYHVRYCGMFDHPFPIRYDEKRPVRKFGVRFFPGGAYPFIKMPLSEFANRNLALDMIWPKITGEIGERIFQAPTLDAKVRIMEHYLVSAAMKNGEAHDDLMANLLFRIFASGGTTSVRELAASEAISARQMNRKFEQYIGFSPKKVCEIVRFQAVIGDMLNSRETDWRYLALNRGYFDQAHLIHDFKRFYGASPSIAVAEYRKMSDFYNRHEV